MFWFLSDALGSVRDIVRGIDGAVLQSYDYKENGEKTASTSLKSDKTWVGGLSVNDDVGDSGLYLMGHRHYDPSLGRFLNRDPIGFGGGLNLFSYGNSPVSLVDPIGLNPVAPPVTAPVQLSPGRTTVVSSPENRRSRSWSLSPTGWLKRIAMFLSLESPAGSADSDRKSFKNQPPCYDDDDGKKRFALGFHRYLPAFAAEHDAEYAAKHYPKQPWRAVVRSKLEDLTTPVIFNMRDVDVKATWRRADNPERYGNPTATDEELIMIRENFREGGSWQRHIFWYNGGNPFIPGLNER